MFLASGIAYKNFFHEINKSSNLINGDEVANVSMYKCINKMQIVWM